MKRYGVHYDPEEPEHFEDCDDDPAVDFGQGSCNQLTDFGPRHRPMRPPKREFPIGFHLPVKPVVVPTPKPAKKPARKKSVPHRQKRRRR